MKNPFTAQTAIQLSTVYACVRVISEAVASLPLGVYEATDYADCVRAIPIRSRNYSRRQ